MRFGGYATLGAFSLYWPSDSSWVETETQDYQFDWVYQLQSILGLDI